MNQCSDTYTCGTCGSVEKEYWASETEFCHAPSCMSNASLGSHYCGRHGRHDRKTICPECGLIDKTHGNRNTS